MCCLGHKVSGLFAFLIIIYVKFIKFTHVHRHITNLINQTTYLLVLFTKEPSILPIPQKPMKNK